ncbi:hypothetical protein ACW23B_01940 [Streptomyces albidoflavus]
MAGGEYGAQPPEVVGARLVEGVEVDVEDVRRGGGQPLPALREGGELGLRTR